MEDVRGVDSAGLMTGGDDMNMSSLFHTPQALGGGNFLQRGVEAATNLLTGGGSKMEPEQTIGFSGAMGGTNITSPDRVSGGQDATAGGAAPSSLGMQGLNLNSIQEAAADGWKLYATEKDEKLIQLMRVPGGVCSAGVQGGLRMCVELSGQCPYQTKGQHQSPVPNRPNEGDICIKFYTARGKTLFIDPRVPAVLAAKLPVLETLLGVDMPLSVATRILEAALAGELAGDDKHVRGHVEAVKDKADTEYTSPFKKIRVASNNEESLEIVNAVNDLIVRVVDLEGRCSGGGSTAGASLGASVSHVKESLDAFKLSLTSQVSDLSVQTNRASALAYASHQVANQAQSGVSSLQALGINVTIPQEVKDRLALLERQHTETSGILGEAVKLLQLQAVKLNNATGSGGGTLGVSHSDSTDLRATVETLKLQVSQVKQTVDGGLIYVGGVEFASEAETFAWAALNMPAGSYSAVASFMGLLQACGNLTVTSSESRQSDIHEAKVNQSALESDLIASHRTTFPPAFGTSSDGESFSYMRKHEDFNKEDGVHGLKYRLSKQLNRAYLNQERAITRFLGGRPTARTVCQDLLGRFKLAIQWLFDRISSFYKEMLNNATPDNVAASAALQASCWEVVIETLKRFFEALEEKRMVAHNAHQEPDSLLGTGQFLRSALLELKLMEDLIKHNYDKHELIFSSIVSYIFRTYVPKSELASQSGNNTELRSKLVAAETTLKAVGKTVDSLSSSVGTVKDDISKAKNEIKGLKARKRGRGNGNQDDE